MLGAAIGAAVAALIAPQIRGFFPVPTGGVGATTVLRYPKGWDYAVVALLTTGAFLGALASSPAGRAPSSAPGGGTPLGQPAGRRRSATLIVFLLMLFAHDHPYSFMDMYHEGEHLAPASVYLDGGKPYKDVFVLHGLATDGGLDALVLGNKPSPLKARRLETDALALTKVRAEATLDKVEGRRLTFTVSVSCDQTLVAVGKVTRVVVDRQQFIEKAG